MSLREYACECHNRRCRERIYLTAAAYQEASRLGRVVIRTHAGRDRIVKHDRTFVVVEDLVTA